MSEIYQILQRARKQRGLTQQTLGEALHIPQSHLSKIESGKTDVQVSNLEEIAHFLGFELMLIPKAFVPFVKASIEGRDLSEPLFQPDEVENE